jgi:8-oxo-dGTP diphosphatase
MSAAMSSTAVIGPSKVIGTKSEGVKYVDRSAVRVIIESDNSEITIIHVTKGNYYKLPGGGVEADEGHVLAA